MFDAPGNQNDRERVRDASDIVRVIGEHVALKAKGREYVGLCPFHDDHKPSMGVVPHKQIFHCFACDTGGDVFTFVQKYHRMTFPEALEYLAQRAGIELARRPAPSPAGRAGPSRRELIAANEAARDFFRAILRHDEHGARARDLIAARGISPEMVDRFELGAAPRTEGWDGLVMTVRRKGFDEDRFVHAGLLKRRADASLYDAFRDRLIFPITNQAGQVVAFGGRRLNDDDPAKYLNSSDSPVFDKSTVLYGLAQASRAIQRQRRAIICEGYTDVIACHQAGLTNAVATLGTALTPAHADLMARLDADVVLLFDGDEAGERAADRAVEVVFSRPIDVRIALLSSVGDAKDPDELLRTEGGVQRLRHAIDHAPDVLEYRFARLRARLAGAGPAELERAIRDELARLVDLGLARVPPVRRQLMLRRLSEITGLPAELIARSVPAGRRAQARPAGATTPDDGPTATLTAPEHLLGCVLCEGTLWTTLDEDGHALLDPDRFQRDHVRALAAIVRAVAADGHEPDLQRVLAATEDEGVKAAGVALSQRIDAETEHDRDRLHAHWHACLRIARRQVASAPTLDTSENAGALEKIEKLRTVMATEGGDNRILPRRRQDAAEARP